MARMFDAECAERRRLELGLTQEKAAERAGLAGGRQKWNDIVSGRKANLTLRTLDRIARALRCSPKDLVK